MRGSRGSGRNEQSEAVEFVPKRELDQAREQVERLQQDNERLKHEVERLRRELEAALRANKRQAAPHSRGQPRTTPSGRVARRARLMANKRAVRFRSV